MDIPLPGEEVSLSNIEPPDIPMPNDPPIPLPEDSQECTEPVKQEYQETSLEILPPLPTSSFEADDRLVIYSL